MSTISVTLIAHNEAANIEACLRSVQWADEIILLDQHSSDGTAEIARKLGATVYQEPWKGYGRQKNSAIEKARGPWILSLDADERVPPELRQEIQDLLRSEPEPRGFFVARKNFFSTRWIRHGGWYPDYNLRLFLKGLGWFQDRTVHESVVLEGKSGYLRHPIEHYTYASISDYVERMNRYSTLAAGELETSGIRPGYRKILFHPPFTFLKMYFLRWGFLDGWPGLFLAISYSYYTFLKYAKLREKTAGWGT
jgi:glycosyltransferase involved in cell wall biosynthesis